MRDLRDVKKAWVPAFLFGLMLALAPLAAQASGQGKIAEGEYEIQPLVASSQTQQPKVASRWALYRKDLGKYRLHSEIPNLAGGLRVVQFEDLDEHFAPTALGYELYESKHTKPALAVECVFAPDSITCSGKVETERVVSSPSYRYEGPFVLWMSGESPAVDLAWLIGGVANQCSQHKGRTTVMNIVVYGLSSMIGDIVNMAAIAATKAPQTEFIFPRPKEMPEFEFDAREEDQLDLVGSEKTQINGSEVPARHYTFGTSGRLQHLLLVGPGFPARISLVEGKQLVLVNYRQYEKLIPELGVEASRNPQPAGAPITSCPLQT